MRTAVRVTITGKVQGVWYRGWAVGEAEARHLDGWVRNRADGTVEALFAGADAAVRDMLRACEKGPAAAHVMAVKREPAADPGIVGFEEKGTV